MNHLRLTAILFSLTTGVALAQSPESLAPGSLAARHGLAGTWRVQVTTFDCASGVKGMPFASMLAFTRDGVLTGTTLSPAFLPGQRTPDFGVWKRTGWASYSVVSEAFILADSPARPPFAPLTRGVQRITQQVELTAENRFVSKATVEFYDVAGTRLVSGCAEAAGTRLE